METTSSTGTEIPYVDTHLAKFSQGRVVALTGLAFSSASRCNRLWIRSAST